MPFKSSDWLNLFSVEVDVPVLLGSILGKSLPVGFCTDVETSWYDVALSMRQD